MADFPFRYAPAFKPLAVVTGTGGGHAEVADGELTVHMGAFFALSVPLVDIAGAQRHDNEHPAKRMAGGIGVHTNLRGTWRVNGALSPMVRITFTEPIAARMLGVPVKVRVLDINPDDREKFLLAIGHPNG